MIGALSTGRSQGLSESNFMSLECLLVRPSAASRANPMTSHGGRPHAEALTIVEDQVRETIRARDIDPAVEGAAVRTITDTVIADYDRRALVSSLPLLGDLEAAARYVVDAVAGYGELQPLLEDSEVSEIWWNEPSQIFVERRGRPELTSVTLSDRRVPDLVERMLKSSGRRLDLSSPFVDAALPDGSRLHVVIPDITRQHWAVNIRKFIARASTLDDLVGAGSLTPAAADFLGHCVAAGLNVLVSGATDAPPVPHTLNHRHLEDCETDPRTAQCRVTYETTSRMKFLFKRVGGSHAEQGARHQGNWVAS